MALVLKNKYVFSKMLILEVKLMNKKLKEWISIQLVEHPRRVVLMGIILFNMIFMLLSAFFITIVARKTHPDLQFFESLYYTISMILDAGCISYVIENANVAGVKATVLCLIVVLIGMISFTGSVIGYVTNAISIFIENASSGKRKLNISNHIVVLNWNNRGSEIIHDLLFCEEKERVVILTNENQEQIQKEIQNKINETFNDKKRKLLEETKNMNMIKAYFYLHKHKFKSNLTVIVRQGDTFYENQLLNISVDQAKTIIILNKDDSILYNEENVQLMNKTNSLMIKTLVLVAEITSKESSLDDQKIIVEVDDEWTGELVQKIIRHKEKLGKCNIIPVPVNKILGQLLSQFAIMPDLNRVYEILFSDEGAEFYFVDEQHLKVKGVRDFISTHIAAVPLSTLNTKTGPKYFYMAETKEDLELTDHLQHKDLHIICNKDYWLPKRNILILGHNSKMESLMEEFNVFSKEWDYPDGPILNIGIIDDYDTITAMGNYASYRYVNQKYVVPTDIYSQDLIYSKMDAFFDEIEGGTCVLILSDDTVSTDTLDANALTYLIYLQDLLENRKIRYHGQDSEDIDVVIELLNPENYDVARSYSVENVVITNRYLSKMINQVGQKEALFDFYSDILTYDVDGTYNSKELYLKKVKDYLEQIPAICTANDLIYNIYGASKALNEDNGAIVLGYIKENGEMIIFSGNQTKIKVELTGEDRLILFSNH